MKAMMLTGIRKMEMKNIPDPVLKKDDDVLIKMSVVGVCGSDIHYYVAGKIGSQVVQYPFPVGHEGAGIVVKTGRLHGCNPATGLQLSPPCPAGSAINAKPADITPVESCGFLAVRDKPMVVSQNI
jgi:threonine dehydrogenase-like Zn-dependent dehydrogenase